MNHNPNYQFRILSRFLPILMVFAFLCQGVYADAAGADTATDSYSYDSAPAPIGPVFIDNTPSDYVWEGVDIGVNYFDSALVAPQIEIIPVPENFCPSDYGDYVPGKFDRFLGEIIVPDYVGYEPVEHGYDSDKMAEFIEFDDTTVPLDTFYGTNKFGDMFDNLVETIPTTPKHIHYDPYIFTNTSRELGYPPDGYSPDQW